MYLNTLICALKSRFFRPRKVQTSVISLYVRSRLTKCCLTRMCSVQYIDGIVIVVQSWLDNAVEVLHSTFRPLSLCTRASALSSQINSHDVLEFVHNYAIVMQTSCLVASAFVWLQAYARILGKGSYVLPISRGGQK